MQASQILNPKYVAQSRSTSARASITPAPHSQAGPKRSFAEASAAGTHNVPGYVDPFMAKMWNDDTMKRFLDEVPEQEWKTLRDFDENFRVAEENAMRFGKPSGTTKTYTPASEQEVSKAARGVHTYREIHSTLEVGSSPSSFRTAHVRSGMYQS